MPLKRSHSIQFGLEQAKEAKKELFFEAYGSFLGYGYHDQGRLFRALEQISHSQEWLIKNNKLNLTLGTEEDLETAFDCYCVLRTFDVGKNITQPVTVYRGGEAATKSEMKDFIINNRIYRVLSTTTNKSIPREFLKLYNGTPVFYTIYLHAGIAAINATARFPSSHIGSTIYRKLKGLKFDKNAYDFNAKQDHNKLVGLPYENKLPEPFSKALTYQSPENPFANECEITLPPGFFEEISCAAYDSPLDFFEKSRKGVLIEEYIGKSALKENCNALMAHYGKSVLHFSGNTGLTLSL